MTATMDGSSLLLKTVRVVNKIGKNIISIGVLLEDGGKMYAEGREMIVEYKGATLVFYKNAKDGLYYIELNRLSMNQDEYCNSVKVLMDN